VNQPERRSVTRRLPGQTRALVIHVRDLCLTGRVDQDGVMTDDGLRAHARALVEANLYLTLGTADPDGRPWLTPVYFAPVAGRTFRWVSAIDARHSRNLAERPAVSVVVFDSTVAPYHGRAVYAAGEARVVADGDVDPALENYPRRDARGAARLTREDVTAPSSYRLYEFTAAEMWVLCPRDQGQLCPRHGRGDDHRVHLEW
jgi:hypothetical protein